MKKTQTLLKTMQHADGIKGMSLGRNNSIYLAHNRNSMFSPITHRPMHLIDARSPQAGRGSATARAQSYQPNGSSTTTNRVRQDSDLALNQQNGLNFTKTSLQARAEGQIKPKAYNAWDILALNDLIKGKIEDQNRAQREHQ